MAKSGKGAKFEREMCKKLSLWWSENKQDDIFWRSSQSGGRATERAKKGIATENSAGDVGYLSDEGKPFVEYFLLELKRGYSSEISWLDLLDSAKKSTPLLLKWWRKAQEEAELHKRKETLLIFKRDRHLACVVISAVLSTKLHAEFGKYTGDLLGYFYGKSAEENLVCLLLDDFLEWACPITLQEFIKEDK